MTKYAFGLFLFLIPWHGLIVTYLKCKLDIDPSILRFWKEIFVIFFLGLALIQTLRKNHWSFAKIYQGNYILGTTTVFIFLSLLYVFFPYFTLKPSSLLGFKYDVFFFLAMLVGMYIPKLKNHTDLLLKSIFTSTGLILLIFLSWYLFFDIKTTTEIFGFSDQVSTYNAHQCLSFSQNVAGHHRLQATFGGPIRFSVFLVVVSMLFCGYILSTQLRQKWKFLLILLGLILASIGIFYSYSKTSILGMAFSMTVFAYTSWKYIYRGKLQKKYLYSLTALSIFILFTGAYIKRDLFLHMGAMINRLDNLAMSLEMFFYNPIGYGLGIAGPATQIGRSIESAGGWQIATAGPSNVSTFLPENWFVQILLEQGIFGFFIFVGLLILIGVKLLEIIKTQKDFLVVGVFSAFVGLCFMALFTHSFEEAATSYSLFLLIGLIFAKYLKSGKHS